MLRDSIEKEIDKNSNSRLEVKGCSTEHVINMGLCIECNNCELGCAARHGKPRLNRQNYQEHSNKEIFPRTCKQCYDRSCVKVCNFGAMRVDKNSEIVFVGENCVGCTLCVEACPYKAITMMERPQVSSVEERNGKGKLWPVWFKKEKADSKCFANKCDLCLGYNDLACINQCPTGALRLRLIHRKGSCKEQLQILEEKGEELTTEMSKKKPLLQEAECVKCGLCVKKCPVKVISMEPYPVIKDECLGCGVCVKVCPKKALNMNQTSNIEAGKSERKEPKVKENENRLNGYAVTIKGEPPITIHVDIKLDSQMTEERFKGLLAVLKSELLEKKLS